MRGYNSRPRFSKRLSGPKDGDGPGRRPAAALRDSGQIKNLYS